MNTTRGKRKLKEKRSLQLPEITALILFATSALAGMFIAFLLNGITPSSSSGNPSNGFGLVLYYIVAVIVMSAIIVYFSKRRKIGILKYLFVGSMVLIIFLVTSILAAFLPVDIYEYYAISFAVPLLFLYALLFKNHWLISDIAGLISSAGLAAFWGIDVGIYAALTLLILFAVYDYIAVYKTKHMLTIAEASANSSIPLFFIIPKKANFKFSGLNLHKGEEEKEEKSDVLILGFGDIALPNVLVVSSYLYGGANWIYFAILPLIGGIIGMIALFLYVKRPAPGLPLINGGVIGGFAIAFLYVLLALK